MLCAGIERRVSDSCAHISPLWLTYTGVTDNSSQQKKIHQIRKTKQIREAQTLNGIPLILPTILKI